MGAHVLPANGWRIHNYKTPEPIIMGFEYEIDHNRSFNNDDLIQNTLPKHYSYAYEHLSGTRQGYEIKSSVAPLRTLKAEVERITPLLELGSLSAQESHGGIHINISKTAYTRQHHEKVFRFLHNIRNYAFLLSLSKRSVGHFQNNCLQVPGGPYSFYFSIITTRKTYAYELRMFGAEPGLLVPALEFAHALFDLAPNVDVLTIANVKDHIKRWKRYSHIHELIQDLNL